MSFRTTALAMLLASTAPLCGQDPELSQEPSVGALIQRLRNPALDEWGRDELVDKILAHDDDGARALFRFSAEQYTRRLKKLRREIEKHLQDFARTAPRFLQKRLPPRATARVDSLRERALKISRSRDLSKGRIATELDPLVEELRELVTIGVHDVLGAKDGLREQSDDIAQEITVVDDLHRIHGVATRALQVSKDGRRFVDRQNTLPFPPRWRRDVEAPRNLAATLATPMSARAMKVMQRNLELSVELVPEEADGILAVNVIRVVLGLAPLAIDLRLCNAARGHSEDMHRLKFFSHSSPVPGKESPGKRAALAGTSGGAENIAAGQRTGRGAIRAWWYSPGHHRNMMGGHGRVGLGQKGHYWTQMFGG